MLGEACSARHHRGETPGRLLGDFQRNCVRQVTKDDADKLLIEEPQSEVK